MLRLAAYKLEADIYVLLGKKEKDNQNLIWRNNSSIEILQEICDTLVLRSDLNYSETWCPRCKTN